MCVCGGGGGGGLLLGSTNFGVGKGRKNSRRIFQCCSSGGIIFVQVLNFGLLR